MKFGLILLAFISISYAFEEPEPINEEERNDEIAQAQERAKQIACLAIVRGKFIEHSDEIASILSLSPHDSELTRHKIIADIAYKCSQEITWQLAEDLLAADKMNLSDPLIINWVTLNTDFYLNKSNDMSWTPEQKLYFEKIENVRN